MKQSKKPAATARPRAVPPTLEERVSDLETGISLAATVLLNWLPGSIALEQAKGIVVNAEMRKHGRTRIGSGKAV